MKIQDIILFIHRGRNKNTYHFTPNEPAIISVMSHIMTATLLCSLMERSVTTNQAFGLSIPDSVVLLIWFSLWFTSLWLIATKIEKNRTTSQI